jgi:Protein of unknown function (DUF1559)
MTQPTMTERPRRWWRWLVFGAIVIMVGLGVILVGLGWEWHRAQWQSDVMKASRNNTRQFNIALLAHREFERGFPPGTVPNKTLAIERRLSWQVSLLPYFECALLYQKFDLAKAWDDPRNRELSSSEVPVFSNPGLPQRDENGYQLADYVGLAGLGTDGPLQSVDSPKAGFFAYDRATKWSDVSDGLSNTAIISEVEKDNGPWAAGGRPTIRSLTKQPYWKGSDGLGGGHPGGWFMGFADGRTWLISEKVDPKVLEAIVTIRGGESVNKESIGLQQPNEWESPVVTN